MKICFLSKYPPIEGGVSSYNYWLARVLARQGHKIFIITNAQEVGIEYREEILPAEAKLLTPPNLKVINTYPLSKRFIPQYPPYAAELASLAIQTIKKEKIDVLYSNYLLPYGVAAHLAKLATGVPWFLDHAGSDITHLFSEPQLQPVFLELFKNADLVVGSPQVRERLIKTRILKEEKLSPFSARGFYAGLISRFFSPKIKPLGLKAYFPKFNPRLPVFLYLGKISMLKKTFAFVKAAAKLEKGKFYLLFITERGKRREQLADLLSKSGLLGNSCLLPFQPPWRIPALMSASTCIVAPESEEEPYLPKGTHGSKICLEGMLAGRCVFIGEGMAKKWIYSSCKNNEHFLTINPNDTVAFSKKLQLIVDNPDLAYETGKRAREFMDCELALYEDAADIFIKTLKFTMLKSR